MEKTTEELKKILTEKFLREELVTKGLYCHDVAKIIGCTSNTISNYAKKFNITPIPRYNKILTKEFLIKNALSNGSIPITKVAKLTNCSTSITKKKVLEFGLKVASLSEVKKGCSYICKDPKERSKNLSNANKGKSRNKGIPKPKGFGEKISKANKNRPMLEKTKQKIRERLIGRKQSEKTIRKRLGKVQSTPNSFEIKCMEHLNKIYPQKFIYCGDGSVMLNGRSVDAISKELKIAYLFNSCYWHLDINNLKRTEENKKLREQIESKPFENSGYKIMFIWGDDRNKLTNEMQNANMLQESYKK